jgi:hypothetical protein
MLRPPSMSANPQDQTRSKPWIVGVSADRSLLARRELDGSTLLFKRYESGAPLDAERECRLAQLAAGPGVVAVHGTRTDAETGAPGVLMDFVEGSDLERVLRREGALAVRTVAAIGATVARTLARLAALRVDAAPHGLVHGDLKPSNLLLVGGELELTAPTVLLVDFEHAAAASAPGATATPGAGFSGGTHGWSPPVAYEGRALQTAADVFGLGACLTALLCGTQPFAASPRGAAPTSAAEAERAVRRGLRARWRLDGCDPRLIACLERCLSPLVDARPAAAELADELERIAATQDGPRARRDAARLAALAGDASQLDEAFASDPRLRTRLARRARLAQRVSLPRFDQERTIDELTAGLPRELRALDRQLRLLPRHRAARELRSDCVAAAQRLLTELPQELQRMRRAGRPDEALARCELALEALRRAGRLGVPAGAASITPIERDPPRAFERLRRDLQSAHAAHLSILRRIEAGEAKADLATIDAAIVELTATYGGASPVVASSKDRRNRLEFYVERLRRLARARSGIEHIAADLGLEVDLEPLKAFAERSGTDDAVSAPRALLRALEDVAQEFPAMRPTVDPARRCVAEALAAITTRAWSLLGDAEHKLATPPIPIRPLVEALDVLDRLRQLDALVDVAAGSRTDLADAMERLRARIEQARAERDRITRGAREALDRGHLTTAIYDMERAVDRFAEGVDDHAAASLAAEYEAALRRKREVEEALERSHVLAARYGELTNTPGSTPQERLAVLREREQTLAFLATNLGPERGAPYVQDLRDVQFDVLRETAADGERRLASARHVAERRAIAQRTLDAILHAVPDSADEGESRQVRSLIQAWSDRAELAAGALRQERGGSVRGRWRTARVASVMGGVLAALALGWWWLSPPGPDAATVLRDTLGEPSPIVATNEGITFDDTRCIALLRAFGATLGRLGRAELAARARAAADAVDDIAARRADFERARAAVTEFRNAFTREFEPELEAVCDEFVRRAVRAAFVTAAIARPSATLANLLRDDELLRQALSFDEAALIASALSR